MNGSAVPNVLTLPSLPPSLSLDTFPASHDTGNDGPAPESGPGAGDPWISHHLAGGAWRACI